MKISLIAAMDKNLGIGAGNKLLWHLPDDFKWFKKHTLGKPVFMGRNTMLSLGKPLPGRENIVVSASGREIIEGFRKETDIDEAVSKMSKATDELMVIGGGMIYQCMLSMADRLYLTMVDHVFPEADTFFPAWNHSEWEEVHREHHPADEKHLYAFDLLILDRINRS